MEGWVGNCSKHAQFLQHHVAASGSEELFVGVGRAEDIFDFSMAISPNVYWTVQLRSLGWGETKMLEAFEL